MLYSFRITALLPFRVGGSDGSLFLLLLLPTGIVIYSCIFQGSTFGYSIAHILLPLFVQTLLFRQKQVMFPCLLCIVALCTHFILMFAVTFIYTLSTELQKSLSAAVNVEKEPELGSSEYVKCLSINIQEIIMNVVLFKSNS